MGFVWDVPLDPGEVLGLGLGPANDQEGSFAQAGDGKVRLDPAGLVEPLGINLRPGATPTSLAEIRLSTAQASRPSRRNLAKLDWSNSPTVSRTALHSAAQFSNQFWRP
jgi:hypothetical protein